MKNNLDTRIKEIDIRINKLKKEVGTDELRKSRPGVRLVRKDKGYNPKKV